MVLLFIAFLESAPPALPALLTSLHATLILAHCFTDTLALFLYSMLLPPQGLCTSRSFYLWDPFLGSFYVCLFLIL